MTQLSPISFDDWKSQNEMKYDDTLQTSMHRLHSIDMKKEYEELLKREYQEYLNDFNGNWLLK